MYIRTLWSRGHSAGVSLPGCQYRMTSYDDDVDCSDVSLAYGLHLHDPRLQEYVGVPELACLLSRSLEYWMHHMGRDRTMLAALQLQHDAGLILSNLQVLVKSINQCVNAQVAGSLTSSYGGASHVV